MSFYAIVHSLEVFLISLVNGNIIKVIAGHGRDSYYIVLSFDDKFAFISNGKERKLLNPKKKNLKHIVPSSKTIELKDLTNKKLRKFLKEVSVND